jgi:hypothetical protein
MTIYTWDDQKGIGVFPAKINKDGTVVPAVRPDCVSEASWPSFAPDDAYFNYKEAVPCKEFPDNSPYKKKIASALPSSAFRTPLAPYDHEASQPYESADTYETCYWKYINATDWDNAKYWLNQTLAKVTMELSPAKDGHSWVEEPERKSYRNNIPSSVQGFMAAIFIIVLIGISIVEILGVTGVI